MAEAVKTTVRHYIVDETGKRVSVVLPIEEYEELLEDMADLTALAERRKEPTIEHSELVRQFKANGLLVP